VGTPWPAAASVVYPTPLPVLKPISVFQDDDGNLLNVSELNNHTAVIGRSGEGKTHLTCHLIMQWAQIKGWNYGWVIAIMPRSVRARAAHITLAQHALTSPLHNMRSHHPSTTCAHITSPATVRLMFGTRRQGMTICSTRRRCPSSTTTPARMTIWG
jgi:hypothetical protein